MGVLPGKAVWRLTGWLLFSGHLAVDLFIVLSGFCLMMPPARSLDGCTLKGGTLQFYKRRAIRIVPTYYAAIALSLLLVYTCIGNMTGSHWDISLPVSRRDVLYHILLVHDVFSPLKINHAMWSVSVEWQIYFLFPLLLLCWRRVGPVVTTVVTVIVAVFVAGRLYHTIWQGLTIEYVGLFALGMLAASLAYSTKNEQLRKIRENVNWSFLSIGGFAFLVGIFSFAGFERYNAHPLEVDLLTGAWVTCLLTGLTVSHNQPSAMRKIRLVLDWPPLAFVGTFAYSIYLIHAPLIQVIWQYGIHPLTLNANVTFLCLIASIPIIVSCAYLFFLLAERPFIHGAKFKSSAPR